MSVLISPFFFILQKSLARMTRYFESKNEETLKEGVVIVQSLLICFLLFRLRFEVDLSLILNNIKSIFIVFANYCDIM